MEGKCKAVWDGTRSCVLEAGHEGGHLYAPAAPGVFTTADLPAVSIEQDGNTRSLLWRVRARRRR